MASWRILEKRTLKLESFLSRTKITLLLLQSIIDNKLDGKILIRIMR